LLQATKSISVRLKKHVPVTEWRSPGTTLIASTTAPAYNHQIHSFGRSGVNDSERKDRLVRSDLRRVSNIRESSSDIF
jgi:hypothetical protein